ncbi:MFS transporter [Sphingomonas sp. BLCC-B65]|nr:MFS transporter [Sphingomonas sp. BLCC-B65]
MPISARAAGALTLAVLTASVGTSAANVALPALVTAFTATPGQVQWVVVAYLLAMTAMSVVVGSLGDLWGRRRVLVMGIAVFTLGALAGGLAPSLTGLIAARAAQGAGAAVMTALPLALARDLSAGARTGRVMGALGTGSAVGTALGPALGGLLVGWGGWAAAFWMMVSLGLLALLSTRAIPASGGTARTHERVDTAGHVLLTSAIALYALALTAPAPDWPTAPLLCGAVVLFGGFLIAEHRAAHPVLPLSMLRHRPLATGMATNVLVATVMMTTLVVGPYALHDGLGLPLALVGLVMAIGPVTSAISGILAGRIVDHASPARLITVSLAVLTAGATALALLPSWWGVTGYIVALLVLTPGYQLFLAANNTYVLDTAAPAQRGTIAGTLGLSRNLGLITGASAMSALYATLTAESGLGTHASLSATRFTFLTAALLAATAATLSLIPAHLPTPPPTATARKENP